jgi:hypothetical protein
MLLSKIARDTTTFWMLDKGIIKETGGTTVEVERQHQDRRMTNSAGRVQNSGDTGGKAAVSGLQSGHFVNFTGPQILVVIIYAIVLGGNSGSP